MDQPGNDARERAVEEAFAHLKALVRMDTTNPPGNERVAVDYVAEVLRAEGIEPQIFEPVPGRANLVARLTGDGSEQPLLLSSHVDVVLAEAEQWTHPPFAAEEHDGFVWGRGTIDMKGMTAFQLATVVALKRAGIALKRDIILLVLADEEAGMTWGSKWMVENHPSLIRAEYALNEVGGFSVMVNGKRRYLVGTGEKGICWMRLRAKGNAGHGSVAGGANATVAIARAVTALSRARLSSTVHPSARGFFEEVGAASRPPVRAAIRGLLSARTREAALRAIGRVQPEQARIFRAMLYNTVTPTGLRAGEKENVIPSVAEAVIDGRVLPGVTRAEFLKQVRRVAGRGIEISVIQWGEGGEVGADTKMFETIQEVTAEMDPGAKAIPWLNVGFTDAAHLRKLGVKCYGYYPLVMPEGESFSSMFHGHDERVPVEGYRQGMRMFMEVVERMAGQSQTAVR